GYCFGYRASLRQPSSTPAVQQLGISFVRFSNLANDFNPPLWSNEGRPARCRRMTSVRTFDQKRVIICAYSKSWRNYVGLKLVPTILVRNNSQRLRMRKVNSPNMLTIRAIRLIISAADTQVAAPAPVV